jgi:hypothetical protein
MQVHPGWAGGLMLPAVLAGWTQAMSCVGADGASAAQARPTAQTVLGGRAGQI